MCRIAGPSSHAAFASFSPARHPSAAVPKDFARRIVAGYAADPAAGMRARAAHVQTADRRTVIAKSKNRARRKHLVEIEAAVHDVPSHKAEDTLEVERAKRLNPKHRVAEAGGKTFHRLQHQLGNFVAVIVPGSAVRQYWRDMLAEQAGDVLPRRRQRV